MQSTCVLFVTHLAKSRKLATVPYKVRLQSCPQLEGFKQEYSNVLLIHGIQSRSTLIKFRADSCLRRARLGLDHTAIVAVFVASSTR